MAQAKEKVERLINKVDTAGTKRLAGKHTLSLGELVFTLFGLALGLYGFFKWKGDKQRNAVIASFVLIFIGELLW